MKSLRAVIYTRVSTDRQAVEGTSLATQETACHAMAEKMCAKVVGVFPDEGVSGESYFSRAGLQAAIREIEDGRADLLITYDISRYSRDSEHQAIIRKRIHAAGGRIVFCTTPVFEDNADGELMFDVVRAFPVWENRKRRERTMLGKRKKAEEGIQSTRLRDPYGYHIVTTADVLAGRNSADKVGRYVQIEDQVRVVLTIFSQYAAGESLNRICQALTSDGFPTPRQGQFWRRSTLKRIIENPVYKGTPIAGRFERKTVETADGKFSTVRERPRNEWVSLSCEPVIDASTWEFCQNRLREGRAVYGGNPERKYMLTGLLRCEICRRGMHGQRRERNARTELHYHCVEQRASRTSGRRICNPRMHNGHRVEQIVLNAVRRLVADPTQISSAVRAFNTQSASSVDADEPCRIETELQELTTKERAIAEAQIDAMVKGRDITVYDRILDGIMERKTALRARQRALQAILDEKETVVPLKDEEVFAEVIRRTLEVLEAEEFTPAEKHDDLAILVQEIVPEGDAYRILLRSNQSENQTVANISIIATDSDMTVKVTG